MYTPLLPIFNCHEKDMFKTSFFLDINVIAQGMKNPPNRQTD